MRRFIIYTGILGVLLLTAIFVVFSLADGTTNNYYRHFTTPKQHSLILGTSKAAHGIIPAMLNKRLDRTDIYNYAFTNVHSPFGKAYLESIKRKHSPGDRPGIFIVTVDIWSLMSLAEDPDDESLFRENGLMLEGMEVVDRKPNIGYLLRYYKDPNVHIITKKFSSNANLNEDGWLEVNVSMNASEVMERTRERVREYRDEFAKENRFSDKRLYWLEQTIAYLQQYGRVYLVRMPVHNDFLELEEALKPDFDSTMTTLALKYQAPYLNLAGNHERYSFIDGIHLHKSSSAVVTEEIAGFILQHR